MVKLRFRRMGRKKLPVFSLVATDSRSPRDGRYIEDLGRFYPASTTDELTLNRERILYWLQQGAQPSDSVRNIFRKEGIMLEVHLLRKGVDAEEIAAQVEAHRTRWAEKAAAVQTESPEERRKKALEAERKAAAEERKRIEAKRQEREAELERQRKEAEEAKRAAAAEEMKGEKEKEDVAEERAPEAEVTETTEVPAEEAVTEDAETEEEAPEAVATQAAPPREGGDAASAEEEVEEKAKEETMEAVEEATAEASEAEAEEPTASEPEAEGTEVVEAAAAEEEVEEEEKEEAKAETDEPDAEPEPEPVAETAPEPEEEAKPDKLTDVWGIGPKYASILNDAGIQTFSTLAEKSVEDLQKIITDAGSTTAGNEETWAEQATLLAKGDDEGHDALVEKLKTS